MDVTLNNEESAVLQAAVRSYLSDLRMEIVDTDNAEYKRTLRHEEEVLNRAIAKLDEAATPATGGESVRRATGACARAGAGGVSPG